MSEKVLVINAGSSSIKWTIFNKNDLTEVASGLAERIAVDGNLEMSFKEKVQKKADMPNHKVAVQEIIKLWNENNVVENIDEIVNVGFRVVHGSTYFSDSTKLDNDAIAKIEEASRFAPLHNPGAVQAMRAFQELTPKASLTANFDTAFHTTIPAVNSTYPIKKSLADKLGVKKYGAHGISHYYITKKLESILGKQKVSFVNLHIGNGASLCAVKDSKSFDTTMGLSPLAGIMMGTRSGDIDPSIHEFVMKESGMSVAEFTAILNKESGLLGVSGVSSDMRDVNGAAEQGNKDAQLALELYVQRIVDYTAAFMNKVGNTEAIVFTAGIGENAIFIRERVINGLATMGLKIDQKQNNSRDFEEYNLISDKGSSVPIYVIKTNEELMIAQDAVKLG